MTSGPRAATAFVAPALIAAACSGGEEPSPGGAGAVGNQAAVTLDSVAGNAAADAGNTAAGAAAAAPVSGSATLRQTKDGVDLILSFTGCAFNSFYAARLYDAADCAAALAQVGQGDYAARDGLAKVACTGTTGFAHVAYSRPNTDPRPWTIAEQPSSANLVGKVLIIEPRDPPTRGLACGKVVPAPADPLPVVALPPLGASADLVDLCTWRQVLGQAATPTCPDPRAVVDCVDTHCGFRKCVTACADRVACVQGLSDSCVASAVGGMTCPKSDACAACERDLQTCMLNFCLPLLSCGSKPTPGGPCSKVEACCAKQQDLTETCLDGVRLLSMFGGDANCTSAMTDWDFIAHLRVPCTF